MSVTNQVLSVALGCLVRMHKVLYTFCVFSPREAAWSFLFGWSTIAPNDSYVDQSNIYQGLLLFWHVLVGRKTEEFWFYILSDVE